MAVRSKTLWLPTALGTGVTALYSAPADETAILKTLTIMNTTVLTVTVTLYLGGATSADRLWAVSIPGSQGVVLPDLFIAFANGRTFRGSSSASSSALIAGFGAELEGVAD